MLHENESAPSPIVPTVPSSDPSPQAPKRRRYGISAMTPKLPFTDQPRPSETSIRSTRSQNLLAELVCNSSGKKEEKGGGGSGGEGGNGGGGGGALELLKAGHRRLVQFAQRQGRDGNANGNANGDGSTATNGENQQHEQQDARESTESNNRSEAQDDNTGGRLAPLDFGDLGDFISILDPPSYEMSLPSSPSQGPRGATSSAPACQEPGSQRCVRERGSEETIVAGRKDERNDASDNPAPKEGNTAEGSDAKHHQTTPTPQAETGQRSKMDKGNTGREPHSTGTIRVVSPTPEPSSQTPPRSSVSSPDGAGSPFNPDSLAPQRVSSKRASMPPSSENQQSSETDDSPVRYGLKSMMSGPGGQFPRLSSDTQSSSPPSTISPSSKQSMGSRKDTIMRTGSNRSKRNFTSPPMGTIPAFPMPPPTTPLPPLPTLALARQGRNTKSSKSKSAASNQKNASATPGSFKAQSPESKSVPSSRTMGRSLDSMKAQVKAAEQGEPEIPGRVCTLRLKDMMENLENRGYLDNKNHLKEGAPSAVAEWLLFPPLSSSPKAQIASHIANRGDNKASRTCPPSRTHTLRASSSPCTHARKDTATATNSHNSDKRSDSPAVASSDLERLSPESWSSRSQNNTPPFSARSQSPQSNNNHNNTASIQRQHTILSHDSPSSQQALRLHGLETRVTRLEHQNKILRAALFATFDIGTELDNTSVRSRYPGSGLSSTDPKLQPSASLPLLSSPSIREGGDPVMKVVEKLGGHGGGLQSEKGSLDTNRPARGCVRDSFDSATSSASIRELEGMLASADIDWMAEGLA